MKNKKYWEFKNQVTNQETEEVEEIELAVNGEIVAIECWEGDVSSNAFKAELDKYPNAKHIKVSINSPGGDVFQAIAIANYLREHKAKVTATIHAMCASAATIIASAADEVKAYNNTIYMIHDPMTVGGGGIQVFKKIINILETIKESIINTYKLHTHLDEKDIYDMMTNETWMSASKALENGFITEIVGERVESEKVDEIKNLMKGQVFSNFKAFPTGLFKNLLSTSNEPKQPAITNKIDKGSEEVMNSNEFKNNHKDVYDEVSTEIKNSERQRISKIVNLGAKYGLDQEVINKAINEGKSEGDFAFEIMNNTEILTGFKAKNQQTELEEETKEAGIENVKTEEPVAKDVAEKQNFVKNTANLIKNFL